MVTDFMIRTMAASIVLPRSSLVFFSVSVLSSLFSTLLPLALTTPIFSLVNLLVNCSLNENLSDGYTPLLMGSFRSIRVFGATASD